MIKAKYFGAYNTIHYKHFETVDDMNKFFENYRMCKLISFEDVQ